MAIIFKFSEEHSVKISYVEFRLFGLKTIKLLCLFSKFIVPFKTKEKSYTCYTYYCVRELVTVTCFIYMYLM